MLDGHPIERQENWGSPFAKIIALNYYDVPTSGVLRFERFHVDYFFEIVDWDNEQDTRVHGLAPLPYGSFDDLVSLFSRFDSPRWPVWYPSGETTRSKQDSVMDRGIRQVVTNKGTPEFLVAWSRYAEQLICVKRLPKEYATYARDWFST